MSTAGELPIRIRRATEADVNFIFNSWLKSFRNSLFSKSLSNTIYYDNHHEVLENLAKTSEILVACNSEDSSQIYGYICAERVDSIFVLHYVYIKHPYRRLGIAKLLLSTLDHDKKTAGVYTHHTKIAERLAAKYSLIHHPYLMFNIERLKDKEEDVGSEEEK